MTASQGLGSHYGNEALKSICGAYRTGRIWAPRPFSRAHTQGDFVSNETCDPCAPKPGGLNETLDALRGVNVNSIITQVETLAADIAAKNWFAVVSDVGALAQQFGTLGIKLPEGDAFPKMHCDKDGAARLDTALAACKSKCDSAATRTQVASHAGATSGPKPCINFNPATIMAAITLAQEIIAAFQALRQTLVPEPAPAN